MKITLNQGDTLTVELADADGTFTIDYDSKGDKLLTVTTELPDTTGRDGIIYCEDFGYIPTDDEIDASYRPAEKV